MAVPVYTTVDAQAGVVQAAIKQAVLKSSDWAHLQLTTGTQATTLSTGASPGATSISTAATIPSGSLIVIGNGAANPECRITTGVSGAGPYTITFADPLVGTYTTGAAVGVGTFMKATTTRGAQMVINLADAAWDNRTMTLGIYRTHDGTTGVDKITRYIRPRQTSTTATDILHVDVSAGKEMIFIGVEGGRVGETGADSVSSYGSTKQCIAITDIVPYFAGDTVAAVACIGHGVNTTSDTTEFINISRDQGNSASWVLGRLASLQSPIAPSTSSPINGYLTSIAKGDGNYYVWPYVVIEAKDGIRGRLNEIFFAGFPHDSSVLLAGESSPAVGSTITYSGNTYKIVAANKGLPGSSNTWTAFGSVGNSLNGSVMYSPLIAVPIG